MNSPADIPSALPFPSWMWVVFALFIVIPIAVDLGLLHRILRLEDTKRLSFKMAVGLHLVWVALAAVFCLVFVSTQLGKDAASKFAQSYLTEFALSVDNLFVFLMIFTFFKVNVSQQYRVLFWGILGALLMRAPLIATGVAAIEISEWFLIPFALILLACACKMVFGKKEESEDFNESKLLKFLRRKISITPAGYECSSALFFVRAKWVSRDKPRLKKEVEKSSKIFGKWVATPLFIVLVFVEFTDFLFAFDSIPVVVGIVSFDERMDFQHKLFLGISSNIFAILGLRTLFFIIERAMAYLKHLNVALAIVLCGMSLKMIVDAFDCQKIERYLTPRNSLLFTAGTLLIGVVVSFYLQMREKRKVAQPR